MMKKQSGKKKKHGGEKWGKSNANQSKVGESIQKAYDKDTEIFILMSQELKDEGNKLFQKRDCEGAMFKYEKAIKLLPRNHIDVSHLRSNMAACYMQMGLSEYPRAIHECNLALEITPKYSKALLKRARCYEALNRLELALRDVRMVLKMEPNNLMATEIAERVKTTIEKKGAKVNEMEINSIPVPEYFETASALPTTKLKEKPKKKKRTKVEENKASQKTGNKNREEEIKEKNAEEKVEEKNAEEKVEEKKTVEIIEKKAEEIIEEMKSEEKIEEKKDEEKIEEKKAEEKVEEKKAEEKKAGEKVEELKAGENIEELKAEEKTVELSKAEGKFEEKKVEKKMEEKKAGKKMEEKKAEENIEEKKAEEKIEEKKGVEKIEEKKAEDKLVVEEKISNGMEEERSLKLVFGEDIRRAKVPVSCSILKLREIIRDCFPSSKSVLIKYRDHEGDLVTITTNEELRWAEVAAEQHGSVRLYIVEVRPEQDPFFEIVKREEKELDNKQNKNIAGNGDVGKVKEIQRRPSCIDDYIILFAELFKKYVAFNSDAYLDIHELGMKLYTEAMEETVTSEEAQDLFNTAADKFQEMAALALFNWGNVHMSRARKGVYFTEDASGESVLVRIQNAYDLAQEEYSRARERYEEALKIKPDFYEGVVALGQQQFEQAKLYWYYAVATNTDLEMWPSTDVIQLYNCAEDNMEKGMQMWEMEKLQHLDELSNASKVKIILQKMGSDGLLKDVSTDEVAEQTENMRSQIYLSWGTVLFERSMMEYKLGLPVWQECLEVAIEKFELAGASPTDIAVMRKNHCSNDTTLEGLGFNIDEIVQAWNDMYEAKKWQTNISSFRLEPLLRRRSSKLYHALEHA